MGERRAGQNGTRRAFVRGLAAGGMLAPSLARAQVRLETPPEVKLQTPEAIFESIVKASVDDAYRMTVPVHVNGEGPFPFVVDTGSNRSVISDLLALKLNLPMMNAMQVHAATGVVSTGAVRVSNMNVGPRWLRDFDAPVFQAGSLGAVGILGIDAVADQMIMMDFRHNRMTIESGHGFEPDPGAVVVRGHTRYGQLVLLNCMVEDIEILVIIDTGGEVTIGNPALRQAVTRRRAGIGTPGGVSSVTGESVPADLAFLPQVRFGRVLVDSMQIAYADMFAFRQFGLDRRPAMLLGMDTLRRFDRVSVDFLGREVKFIVT